jgi:hypothetical protein
MYIFSAGDVWQGKYGCIFFAGNPDLSLHTSGKAGKVSNYWTLLSNFLTVVSAGIFNNLLRME